MLTGATPIVATVLDVDRLHPALADPRGQPAQGAAQVEQRPQPSHQLGGQAGNVHGITDDARQQGLTHRAADLHRDPFLRLGGGCREVRCQDDAVRFAERRIGGERLLGEYVEGGTGNAPGGHRFQQCRFIDDAAPRGIHQHRGFLHLPETAPVEQVPGFVGRRQMQRYRVGAGQQIVQ